MPAADAARVRLRAIVMMSLTSILGASPLVISYGGGTEMCRPLDPAVFRHLSGGP